MDEIFLVDSIIETSIQQSDPNLIIEKLRAENFKLTKDLNTLTEKIENALKGVASPRTLSEARRGTRTNARASSNQPIKHTTNFMTLIFSNPLFKILETKVSELESENLRLKSELDKNHISGLDKRVQPLFERHQKFLKSIFKSECILAKIQREVQENSLRISELQSEFTFITSQTPHSPKPKSSPRLSNPDPKIQRLYSKEQKLFEELSLAKICYKDKQKLLNHLTETQENYLSEIKTLEKAKFEEFFCIRQNFSPQHMNKVISDQKIGRRDRQRFSTEPRKVEMEQRKSSGNLRRVNREATERVFDNGEEVRIRAPRIFRNVNLSPEEFRLTHELLKNAFRGK